MKHVFMFVPMAGLLLGLMCNGWTQTDRLYPIYELTDEDLALIDIHDGSVIPKDTAVENRSWGRIKASFRE